VQKVALYGPTGQECARTEEHNHIITVNIRAKGYTCSVGLLWGSEAGPLSPAEEHSHLSAANIRAKGHASPAGLLWGSEAGAPQSSLQGRHGPKRAGGSEWESNPTGTG